MPRETQREKLLEKYDQNQLPLLDEAGAAVCMPVLEAIRQRRYEHTGARLVEDEAKAIRLVELLCYGWGVARIARDMSISKHTVRAARRELARQGKLAPHQQRVNEAWEDAIEAGAYRYRDGMEEGAVPLREIPVGTGIFFDKKQLALGQATSISGRVEADDLPSVDKLNKVLDVLVTVTADSSSVGDTQKPKEIAGSVQPVASFVATGTDADRPAQAAQTVPTGAGGVTGGGGLGCTDPKPSEI